MRLTHRLLWGMILELLSDYRTSVPVLVGGTVLLTSPLLGLSYGFYGLISVVGGLAWALTNGVLHYDDLRDQKLRDEQAEQMQARERALDELSERLKQTTGTRDEELLEWLRSIYRTFLDDIKAGKYTEFVDGTTLRSISLLFNSVVQLLQNSFDLWEDANQAASGEIRKVILADRKQTLEKVEAAISNFNKTVAGVRSLTIKSKESDLERVSKELDSSLNVARSVQEEMQSIQDMVKGNIRVQE